MAGVTTEHDEFSDNLPIWKLVSDCVKGSHAVKEEKTTYLPKPNPTDASPENDARYEQYVERAMFYNVTSRTLRGFIGQVYAREATEELPEFLDVVTADIDGTGVSLEQQSRKALGCALATGRAGLLADFPPTEEAVTREQIVSGDVKPTITLHKPESIINWRVQAKGNKQVLTLVTIAENAIVDDDGFEAKVVDQYRELRLIENIYVVNLWRRKEGDPNKEFEIYASYVPKDYSGNALDYIPFCFIGSENNDPEVDYSPLYDLATLNIGHYRNSADYEESCFIVGQPTPYISGLSEHWVTEVLKGEIYLGSRAAVPLPEGGSMNLVQAAPNTMPFEAMQHKERQMISIGAKLVEQKQVQRTATEAGHEHVSEVSVLSMVTNNVSDAYEKALYYASRFLSDVDEESIVYRLNTDFEIGKLNPQERAQLISEWQTEAITFTEMREGLRKSKVAFLEDEEAKKELEESEPPMGTVNPEDEDQSDETEDEENVDGED